VDFIHQAPSTVVMKVKKSYLMGQGKDLKILIIKQKMVRNLSIKNEASISLIMRIIKKN